MSLENETIKELLSKVLDKIQPLDSIDIRFEGLEKEIKNLSSNIHDIDKKFDNVSGRLVRVETKFEGMEKNHERLEKKHDDDITIVHNKFRDFKPEITKQISDVIKNNSVLITLKNMVKVKRNY